jgi:hypothetical protein
MSHDSPAVLAVRRRLLAAALAAMLCGCVHAAPAAPPPAADPQQPAVSLHGASMVILIPATADEQTADRQRLAQLLLESLHRLRADLTVTPLDATLSALGSAGLINSYEQMYVTYRTTGVFDPHALQQLAQAAGGRYILQLRLESLDRSNGGGIGGMGPLALLGVRRKQTLDMHLSAQVWDGTDGTLVWHSASQDRRTKRSLLVTRTVSLGEVAGPAAEALVKQLPL